MTEIFSMGPGVSGELAESPNAQHQNQGRLRPGDGPTAGGAVCRLRTGGAGKRQSQRAHERGLLRSL